MASINKNQRVYTHEGARAVVLAPELELRRSVLSCFLWEKEFYENGEDIATRIGKLVRQLPAQTVGDLAVEARNVMHLRHVPLLLAREMARDGRNVSKLLPEIIQRPDELTEFLAIYWKDGKQPLSASVKKGLARAFTKFDAYQLAKYDRPGAIRLRDVLFLVHPKPADKLQQEDWDALVNGTLKTPDTWETNLSAGADKEKTFTRLMEEQKLGGMAFLRNLRGMLDAGVPIGYIRDYFGKANFSRVLPFRFISAAMAAPQLEPELERAMIKGIGVELTGKTKILVDVSGSMGASVSTYSHMNRMNAAFSLAMVLREMCEDPWVYTFSERVVEVPPRHGFALRDAMANSQRHWSTQLGAAVKKMDETRYDRLIVITDEQSHDRVPEPHGVGYMINVASAQRGVGYGKWNHIDGFSEGVVKWLVGLEHLSNRGKK